MISRRILFVDDQQEPLFYHKIMLEQAGYMVLPCRSAEESITYVEKMDSASHCIDLIILDVNMTPDGRFSAAPNNSGGRRTGILLFKALCSALEKQSLVLPPFIVLTQLQDPQILEEAAAVVPGTPVLDKFETGPAALLERVNEILQAKH